MGPVWKKVIVKEFPPGAEGLKITCPQHGFRIARLVKESKKRGALVAVYLRCPRCSYLEERRLEE